MTRRGAGRGHGSGRGRGSGEASWPAAFDTLTPRQRDIALLVAAGQTNRQIGERLYLSEHTVRNQLVNIFRTLGVTRRSELSALAARTSRPELKT